MIRRGLILIGAVLLPFAAGAEDGGTKAEQAFVALCTAAMDEGTDVVSIATSLAMKAAGGMMDAVVTTGRTSFRVFTSSQSKQTILVATTTYSDARVINCKSTVQVPTASAELENLAQSMKLESGFLQVDGAVTTGRWKRPGNVPAVFVTMLSNASATVLSMERIDIPASATEKK